MRMRIIAAIGLLATAPPAAQWPTIPEIVAREGRDTGMIHGHGSGAPPTLSELLDEVDVIARGVVGRSRSYMTDDQTGVLTDYRLVGAVVLLDDSLIPAAAVRPRDNLAVTISGGTITINGVKYSETFWDFPTLPPGIDGLFLLRRVGDRLLVAGQFYGAFKVNAGLLTPVGNTRGFAPELLNAPVDAAVEDMISRRVAVRRR